MKSTKIYNCRICSSGNLKKAFSLGKISHTGIFPSKKEINVPKDYINITYCQKCSLVQLDRNFNLNYMFGKNYGYKSGVNNTMISHLNNLVKELSKKFKIKKKDYVLDIASNDGTLLNSYDQNVIKVGVDPLIKKFNKNYKNINYKISNFFDFKHFSKMRLPKFKIITAIAVMYDLPNPNKFIKDINKILDKDGVFIIEVADLYLTMKNNVFDTFCHEHLEYYSYKSLNKLITKNGLKIFDHKYLSINGGSSRYYISKKNSKFKVTKNIRKLIEIEKKSKINNFKNLIKFYESIVKLKENFKKKIFELKKNKFKLHGYGASTKGNVLIQFYNITPSDLDFIAEKNKQKFNCYTPGSKIKIISESKSRKLNPDYYVVFPWHFKKEILKREKIIRKKGTKFIFPLPKFQII